MKRTLPAFAGMAALAVSFMPGSACAAYPASVVGTWTIVMNQSQAALRIFSQAPSGICRKILGEIGDTNVEGFYCPRTGRIVFLRKFAVSNDTFQVFVGNLASDAARDRMAGTFAALSGRAEYSFHATR